MWVFSSGFDKKIEYLHFHLLFFYDFSVLLGTLLSGFF